MNWPTWKADLIAIAISMIIVAPFALYGPLWLLSTGSGVTADVIEAYLNTRDGYPGSITGARPPITLPRVSCLERE